MYSLEVSLSFSIFGLISQSLCIVSNVLPIGSSHYRVFTFPERIQQKLQHKTLHRSHHRGTLLPSVCVFGCQIDIKLYTLLSLQCLFLFFFFVCQPCQRGRGMASRVYLQLATIVAEMHFTLAHFGGCTSSQSQSQDTSHVVPHSAFMGGFCSVLFSCVNCYFSRRWKDTRALCLMAAPK